VVKNFDFKFFSEISLES